MKIALLSFHFSEYSLALARALSKRHKVLLFLSTPNVMGELGGLPSDEDGLQIRCLGHYTFYKPGCLKNIETIIRKLNRFDPDVIHCQDVSRDFVTPILPFIRRKPLVVTIHDSKPHSGDEHRFKLRTRLNRYFLRRAADAAIVHGGLIKQETETLLPWLRGRVHVVPHGILGAFDQGFQTDWDTGTLLFFGRVKRYKGLSYLIEAVEILKSRQLPIRVVVAGTGPDLVPWRDRLIADPTYTVIEEYIPPNRVPELFRQANVVVLPYIDATQSGVAAFALGCGRPVVASDVGSLHEMVRHGENGLLVPPCDSKALADAMAAVLLNKEDTFRLAQNAYRLGQSDFSWARISELTENVYLATVERQSKK